MGYSGRYHAASLAAVFLALAIGILIGIGLAGDVVSSASESLEASLRSGLEEAETRADELDTALDRERGFSDRAYPALVANRLSGSSVALIGVGELPRETAESVQEAIEPAGAEVAVVASATVPPQLDQLRDQVGRRFGPLREAEAVERLARRVGAQIVGDGPVVQDLRDELFSRFNGDLDEVDRVVLLPVPREGLDDDEAASAAAFERGLADGLAATAAGAVAVTETGEDATMLEPFAEEGITTVDHADLTAGRLAIVLGLLGTEGDYGVGEQADALLPDLIDPPRAR
jgi:hypothetical protein